MSIEGLGASLGLLALLVLWVAAPVLRRRNLTVFGATARQRERLLAHYDRVLTNIRDLDEDYATEKINDEAYALERERLMQNGVQVLVELDKVGGVVEIQAERALSEAELDSSIDKQSEQAVAAYRKVKA